MVRMAALSARTRRRAISTACSPETGPQARRARCFRWFGFFCAFLFGSRVPAPVTFSGGACGSGSTTYYTYVFPCLLCCVHLFHHFFLEAWPWSEVLGCLLPMSPHHWPAAWSWPFDKSPAPACMHLPVGTKQTSSLPSTKK